MRYLVILIFLMLVGCIDEDEARNTPDLAGIPSYHTCRQYRDLGWKIDPQACYRHFINPKFKIGKKVYINSPSYDKKCTFAPTGIAWSGKLNKPMYFGKVSCPDAQFLDLDDGKLEEELKG